MMEKMEVRGGPSSDLGRGRERGGRKKKRPVEQPGRKSEKNAFGSDPRV
jgi:hypothetical protein